MKKYILQGAVGTAALATMIGLYTCFETIGEYTGRHASAATCVGLLSIALFFIGMVYPKE